MPSSHNGHISITGVSKYYGRHKALDDVSLEIPPGTVTVILGPSGSGKSTLLRTINHLERVDEGFIQIDGDYIGYRRKGDKLYEMKEKEILRQRINVGYVFQNFNLFPHLTVLENLIEAPIAHQQVTRKEAIARAYELLDVVGLRNKADAWSRHLSGGQQQRIAIARALAQCRDSALADTAPQISLMTGYHPGMIGRIAQMHGEYYARHHDFGAFFEGKVASGVAEFATRLSSPANQIWLAIREGKIVGSLAIDGEDLGQQEAHLRWFILDDSCRGTGIGRRLLSEAMAFCDSRQFSAVQLWTFKGLDAARKLYESFGFTLIREWQGEQWGKVMTEQQFTRSGNTG